jgi:hypothetical protein
MKNIHVLTTDQVKNIYITSDEVIKVGDEGWSLNLGDPDVCKFDLIEDIDDLDNFSLNDRKIILTTDVDLITDGVQSINNNFLEWFSKNPNCEYVELIKVPYFDESGYSYLLITEPEKETLEEYNETEIHLAINKIIDGGKDLVKGFNVSRGQAVDYAFDVALKTAKWQSDRMYSEEEVKEIAFGFYYAMSRKMNVTENLTSENATNIDIWFEESDEKIQYIKEKNKNKKALISTMYELHRNRKNYRKKI